MNVDVTIIRVKIELEFSPQLKYKTARLIPIYLNCSFEAFPDPYFPVGYTRIVCSSMIHPQDILHEIWELYFPCYLFRPLFLNRIFRFELLIWTFSETAISGLKLPLNLCQRDFYMRNIYWKFISYWKKMFLYQDFTNVFRYFFEKSQQNSQNIFSHSFFLIYLFYSLLLTKNGFEMFSIFTDWIDGFVFVRK